MILYMRNLQDASLQRSMKEVSLTDPRYSFEV